MDPRARLDGNPPASAADLAALAEWSPAPLPAEYLAYPSRLSMAGAPPGRSTRATSGSGPARTVVESNRDYEVQRWVPGLVGFGDDGGPVFLAFDTRSGQPYPVIVVPFAPMEFESAQVVAGSFEAFLGQLLPREQGTDQARSRPGPHVRCSRVIGRPLRDGDMATSA